MGIKVLHYLCDRLNSKGNLAFLLPYDQTDPLLVTAPNYLAPRLDREIFEAHISSGLTPIVVYPEIVAGNPLDASLVARYVLNFPGLIGGDTSYAESELVVGFSKELSDERFGGLTLTLAPWDLEHFDLPDTPVRREGSCFYSLKHRFLGGKLLYDTASSTEITQDMEPIEIAKLFQRSEVFYCYENTALVGEALLCGCPVILLSDGPPLTIIGQDTTKGMGIAQGNSREALDYVKSTVLQGRENLLNSISLGLNQLDHFVRVSQEWANAQFDTRPPKVEIFGVSNDTRAVVRSIHQLGIPELLYSHLPRSVQLASDSEYILPVETEGIKRLITGRLVQYNTTVFIPYK